MVGRDSRSNSRSRSLHISQSRNHRRSSRSRDGGYSQRSKPDSEYRSSQYRSKRSPSPQRIHSPSRRGREILQSGRSLNRSPEIKGFSRESNSFKENITRKYTRLSNIGNSDDFFKSRRKERSSSSLTFWPDSDQISSTSEESDHKTKKTKKRLKESEEHSKRKKSRSKKKEKSHKSKKSSRRSESPDFTLERSSLKSISTANKTISQQASLAPASMSLREKEPIEERWPEKKAYLEEAPIGPTPAPVIDQKIDSRSYGSALLAGEAEAMAAYIQSGKRIPRRGEIGLKSDQIEMFEQQGFVMSGSRHQRMNAVRIRKENQIISAEEKRALLNLAQEEHAKRENKIIADLREMVSANRTEE